MYPINVPLNSRIESSSCITVNGPVIKGLQSSYKSGPGPCDGIGLPKLYTLSNCLG
jgi:hypothetical protein